ncbi:uncharacterized protein YcbK (DUF882 family) [Evansella vedderi]|uniref:Uncharacterized protein YcbK (DUF882 family) n=1 Tax=Evansella vedderi TaxID=38282 RepID=A0ABT9ZWE4_9BACI|nr:DnaJ family domain-containing protein [Evansella vedderi]MDQ0255071.1 uncharacterized protein YcbK (DUF882 family) [Evansella vedderi]
MADENSRDLIGDIYKDYEKKGGFEKLKGMGKPLPDEVLKADPLYSVLKNANYLPEWVKQRQKVRDEIEQLLEYINKDFITEKEAQNRVKAINKNIKKYNKLCPVILQKQPVSLNNLSKDLVRWE